MNCLTCDRPLASAPASDPIRLTETADGSVDVLALRRTCADDAPGETHAEDWVRPQRADVRLAGELVGSLLVTDSHFPLLAGWWQPGPAWELVEERVHRLTELHDRDDHRFASIAARLADEGLTVAFADGQRGDVLLLVRPDGTAELDATYRHPLPGGLTREALSTAV